MRRNVRTTALLLLCVAAQAIHRLHTDCDEASARPTELLTHAQREELARRLAGIPKALLGLRAFLLFVGYSRSGHTLIGALLDGHPNAIVSNEGQAMRHAQQPRPELLSLA